MAEAAPDVITLSVVVVVVLVNYLREHQAWGWMRMVQGSSSLKGVPGVIFAKVMGSGHGGGFSIRPSASHQGLIVMFERAEQADAFLAGPIVQAYRQRAAQFWSGVLEVLSSRGQWDGEAWGSTPATHLKPDHTVHDDAGAARPLAVITRASIRPAKAMAFWRNAPATQTAMQSAAGCTLAMGLGEAPLVRQCTFSLWKDTSSMLDYAHQGAHQAAIEAAYRHNYFSESMFVRMRLLEHHGHWTPPHAMSTADTTEAPANDPEPKADD